MSYGEGREPRRVGLLDGEGELQSLSFRGQAADLACHGDGELSLELGHHRHDQVFFLKKVGAIVSLFGDALGASKIDIHGIAVVLHKLSCG